MKLPPILFAVTATAAFSQGSLTPPGAPAPTQKSLQEIWNELQSVKAAANALQTTANAQEAQIASLKTQLTASTLLDATSAAGQALPWIITTVDSVGFVGAFTSLAFGPDGQPAISYYDSGNADLKFARFNGTAWALTTIDSAGGVGLYTSLAFGPDGQPAIAYYNRTRYPDGDDGDNGNLEFARFNGTAWTLTTVDSTGDVGIDASLAFVPDGQPAISYYDATNGDLKFARFNGTTWTLTIVDSIGDVGRNTSIAFGADGQPAISYTKTGGELRFARFNGTTWTRTTVPTNFETASSGTTSLAFGPDGHPAISFYDANLGFAQFDGEEWSVTTAASGGGVSGYGGEYSALIFGPDGQPTISYSDFVELPDENGDPYFDGNLRFARFNGTSWSITTVDNGIELGYYNSLVCGPDGQPAISYESGNGELRFARKGLFKPAP